MTRFLLLVWSLLAVALAGCNRGTPVLAKVRGRVAVNGIALSGGTIVFSPDLNKGNRGPSSHAVIAIDGSYELSHPDGIGAYPGWYRVTVAVPYRLERYRQPELSGLTREVKPGIDNVFDFDLTEDP
jgi:hypothetical protein